MQSSAQLRTSSPNWHILAVLSLLMGFASISTDLYLPAMPVMARSLRAADGMIELSISGYLVGFSLGQLFWGPISDRFGRRPAIAFGLVLFIIGSSGCALAEHFSTLIFWRIIQALGACASVALSRAMVRDLYQGAKGAQMLSILVTIMAIMPLVGPLIGGQVVTYYSWRVIFWLLVVIGLLTLAALATIPETLHPENRNNQLLSQALLSYAELLKKPRILGYLGTGGFLYAGMFAYVAGSPFAYISYYHVPPRLYGFLFGLSVIGIMATNLFNARIVVRLGYDRVLLYGTFVALMAGLISCMMAVTGIGGLWGLVIPIFIFVSTTGLIVTNSITGALADFPRSAGAVSALTGSVQYGSGVIGSGAIGLLADGTPWPLGLVIAISGIGCFLAMLLIVFNKSRTWQAVK